MGKSSDLKYYVILLFANILFGVNYSFYSSIIGHIMTSNQLFALRIVAMALVFVPFMFITGRWKIDIKDFYKFAIIGLVVIFGRMYMMLYAMNYTSPIDSSIIATMNPILIMLISAILIKEKITMKRTFGILLGAAGALLLVLSNAKGGGFHEGKALGNILIMVSIIFSAFNTVFVKKFIAKYDPFTILGWAFLVGAVVVLPVFGHDLVKIDTKSWSGEMWLEVGYIIVLGSIIASAMAYYPLKKVSATSASMYAYSQPIAATALAVWRGQDKITIITIISAALIFFGVFMVILSYKSVKAKNELPSIH